MRSHKVNWLATIGAVALLTSACTDEKIVYRDGPNIVAPPVAAASFVGYSDQATKRTVCGSCHAEIAAKWATSKHAGAWATLQANSGKQAFCNGCHTVNGLGNNGANNAGYLGVADKRYEDVQCESCHGAGLTHASSPTTANRLTVLASVNSDTGSSARAKGSCGACHNGSHHPYDKEWRSSAHGAVPNQSSPGGRAECIACHEGQAALKEIFKVTSNFKERNNDAIQATGNRIGITCAVCHDPHGGTITGQLRAPISSGNEETQLCAQCHHKRGAVDVTSTRGPHSPEGPTLFGTAGWWPPGMRIDTLVGTHGDVTKNPRTCASCHLERITVNDPATGNLQLQVVGHSFNAISCVDANGRPTGAHDCQPTQRSWKSCAASGCHSETSARSVWLGATSRAAFYNTTISALIARIPTAEFSNAGGIYRPALGIRFNRDLIARTGSIVHNPALIDRLALATIDAAATFYNVRPTAQEQEQLLQIRSELAAKAQLGQR